MYWDDWKQNSIFVADKESGLGVGLVLDQLAGLMDMKVKILNEDATNALSALWDFIFKNFSRK